MKNFLQYPYSPPEGYYDLPFTWIFDAGDLVDGSDALNRFVYMQGGYGDFILRRIVGLDRVLLDSLATPPFQGGRYRTYDRYGSPMQSAPQNIIRVSSIPGDVGIAPEEIYPELGKIAFDLYSILKISALTAQIAFKGIRRMKGTPPKTSYRHQPKTFSYIQTVSLTGGVDMVPILMRQQIRDYDFELFDIRLLKQSGGSAGSGGEAVASVSFFANPGTAPFTIEMLSGSGTPNLVLSVIVVPGVSITIQGATDGAGSPLSTSGDMLALFNATPDAVALAQMFTDNPAFGIADITPPVVVQGSAWEPINLTDPPFCKLWIRDKDRIAIASEPVLDIYCDGGPASAYVEGSIVPPLLYPKDQLLQIDVSSVIETFTTPVGIMIEMVGRQLIPC